MGDSTNLGTNKFKISRDFFTGVLLILILYCYIANNLQIVENSIGNILIKDIEYFHSSFK